MFDWVAKNNKKPKPKKDRSLSDLFALQRGPLLRFVISKIKNEAEAEEIVQECFIRFQAHYKPDETASPEALLARIASNLVIDKVREKKARGAREEAWGQINTAGADSDIGTSQSVDPARILSAKQQIEAVMELLDTWPDKTRQIFLLHRFEGLSHAEVSERTGIPKSTIEKHMIKAIKALAVLKDET